MRLFGDGVPVKNFNPRTREGCDCGQGLAPRPELAISIHAPVNGATGIQVSQLWRDFRFQSTHP